MPNIPSQPRPGRRIDHPKTRRTAATSARAGDSPHWLATLVRLASRTVNGIRLIGRPAHRRRVATSRRVLRTVRRFVGDDSGGRLFAYLRRVEPLVFEETILSALEDAGAFVLRNRRYTGDGGVDGRCWLPGRRAGFVAIQCKRYSTSVAPQHLAAFCALVERGRHGSGLFVHCGRTGPQSYGALRHRPVDLVSGDGLLDLVLRRRLPTAR